jgi:hypothetical protein
MERRPVTLDIHEDDVFLVSYPRSGNTWVRFLIANLKYPGRNLGNDELMNIVPDMYQVRDWSRCEKPRIIKSHECYQQEYPKVVYVFRDGRDVAVSYYFFNRKFNNYIKPFDAFVYEMLEGKVMFGSWQDHIREWLFRDHEIDLLPIQFEDIYRNKKSVLEKLGSFLNIARNEEVFERAARDSTLEKQSQAYASSEQFLKKNPSYLKNNVSVVKDTRAKRGVPGTWKDFFNEKLLEDFWDATHFAMEKLGYEKY